jgi:phage-related minor tail protein
MNNSLFDDDQITKAQSLLATFTNIKDKIYMDAIPAAVDLASKLGGDLNGAVMQVGKALQDPAQGLTALRRSGVSFSDAQIKVIKSLFDTGREAEAQSMILAELNKEFGGAAAAAAAAGTGPFTIVGHKFQNAKEKLGELVIKITSGLLPAMEAVVKVFETSLNWLEAHKRRVRNRVPETKSQERTHERSRIGT